MPVPGGELRGENRMVLALVLLGILTAPLGTMFAPAPVALCVARSRWALAVVSYALLVAAAAVAFGRPEFAVGWALVTAVGIPVGFAFRLGWSYNRIVVVATVLLFGVSGVGVALAWDAIGQTAEATEKTLTEYINGPDAAEIGAFGQAIYEGYAAFLRNWQYSFLGMLLWIALTTVCVTASITAWWVRRIDGLPDNFGGFRTLRPPDWLVWVVIGAALLWFAEQRWNNEALRILAWNTGWGLFAVYWLNGLSVLVYGFYALRPNPFIAALVIAASVWLTILPFLGLFDTWGEFRQRIDKLRAAREAPSDSPDDDDEQE